MNNAIYTIKNYFYDKIIVKYKLYKATNEGYLINKVVNNNSSKYINLIKTGAKDIKIRYKDYDNLTFVC